MTRLLDLHRRGVPITLEMKLAACPTIEELDGMVSQCGARGQELSPAERSAVAIRRAELQREARA